MSADQAKKKPIPRLRRDRHGREELTMADWALAPGPMPRMKTQPAESKKA
jgi:hypothetical protein